MRHLRNRKRLETFHELLRSHQVELGIGRLDTQKETIARYRRELLHVEYRVIRLRQSIQREHAEHASQSGKQDRHLKSRNDERRPRVIRFPADRSEEHTSELQS